MGSIGSIMSGGGSSGIGGNSLVAEGRSAPVQMTKGPLAEKFQNRLVPDNNVNNVNDIQGLDTKLHENYQPYEQDMDRMIQDPGLNATALALSHFEAPPHHFGGDNAENWHKFRGGLNDWMIGPNQVNEQDHPQVLESPEAYMETVSGFMGEGNRPTLQNGRTDEKYRFGQQHLWDYLKGRYGETGKVTPQDWRDGMKHSKQGGTNPRGFKVADYHSLKGDLYKGRMTPEEAMYLFYKGIGGGPTTATPYLGF